MNARVREILIGGGIDIDALLERCMGNEFLVERLLKKFPGDSSYEKLQKSMETGDVDSMLDASHTLKGVCGNLSINDLFNLLNRQVQIVRSGNTDEAKAMMADIVQKYEQAVQAIEKSFV